MEMINKIASTIEMSFDIPTEEQKEAELASDYFSQVINALNYAKDHLNIIYDPFQKAENLTPEAVWEYRSAVRRYSDQIIKNYNKVKAFAFKALMRINVFSSDTHIMELINSFKDSINDLKKQVNILLEILEDLKSVDFKKNVMLAIENVRKQSSEIEKLIRERILDHIDSNILSTDWISDIGEDMKMKFREKIPYITQLFQERQDAIDNK